MKLYEQPKIAIDSWQIDVLSESQVVSPDWQDDPFTSQAINLEGGELQ